jgi:hypothetical protein
MTEKQKRLLEYVLIGLSLLLGLVGSYFGISLPTPALPSEQLAEMEARLDALQAEVAPDTFAFSAGYNTPCYREQGGAQWVAESGCSWEINGGKLELVGTTYELTSTQTLTPTTSSYVISSTAVVTLTLGGGTAGDLVLFTNVSGNDAVFVDTGATSGGGSRTLGQYDVIGFIYNDAKWIESFFSDNS